MEKSSFALFFEIILKDKPTEEIRKLQQKLIEEEVSTLNDLKELSDEDLKALIPQIGTRNRIKKGIKIISGDFELDESISDFWGEEKYNSEEEGEEAFQQLLLLTTDKKKQELIQREKRILAKYEKMKVGAGQVLVREAKEIWKMMGVLKQSGLCKVIFERAIKENAAKWGAQAFKDTLKVNIFVTVGVAAVESGYAVMKFMKGEITGKECAKSITQAVVGGAGSFAGSFGGAIAGAYVGSLFGPIGAIVGYVVGVGVGGLTGYLFGSLINEFIWGLFEKSKDDEAREALIKAAFKQLNATEKDSWVTIAKNYRTLALANHPDKFPGASEEDKKEIADKFSKLNEAYQILKHFYLKEKKVGSKEEVQDIQKMLQIEFEE